MSGAFGQTASFLLIGVALSWSGPAVAEPSADASEPASTSTRERAFSALEVSAGPRAVHRDFGYSDQVATLFPSKRYPQLAPYQLGLGPAVFANAELFPGAFTGRGVAANLGVTLSYERAFATRVIFAQGTAYERTLDTRASELFAGLKARLPLGIHAVSLTAGYGQANYELVGDEAVPVVPDVAYRYLGLDGAARFQLGAPFLGLHAGTRLVQDSGALGQTWFAGAKTRCFEGGVSAGYALGDSLELFAAFDVIRYGFDFNPIPASADPWTRPVAGGAVDQYLVGTLALRYRLGRGQAVRIGGHEANRAASRD